MNKFKKQAFIDEPVEEKIAPTNYFGANKLISVGNKLNIFEYLNRATLAANIKFVVFLFVLGMLYIGNSLSTEGTIREIDKAEKDIKELRSEFITGKSDLMFTSKMTEVAKAIKIRNIQESTLAPKKITVN